MYYAECVAAYPIYRESNEKIMKVCRKYYVLLYLTGEEFLKTSIVLNIGRQRINAKELCRDRTWLQRAGIYGRCIHGTK